MIELVGKGNRPVSIDYFVALQEYAAERGVTPQKVFEGTLVPYSCLIQPDVWIGHASMDRAIENVLSVVDSHFFPFDYGRRFARSNHGVLGYAAQNAGSLIEAANLLEQYIKTRSDSFEKISILTQGDTAVLRLFPFTDSSEIVTQFHTIVVLISIETIARRLTGNLDTNLAIKMNLAFECPSEVPQSLFRQGLDLAINQPFNELRFPLDFFTQRLEYSSAPLFEIAQAACKEELNRLSPSTEPISAQVRKLIRKHKGKPPKINALASILNLSSRTLIRRLRDDNTTYQDIKDSERFRKAIGLLEENTESIECIADKLGFSDASNFTKAFKNWSNMSPGDYRKQLLS